MACQKLQAWQTEIEGVASQTTACIHWAISYCCMTLHGLSVSIHPY